MYGASFHAIAKPGRKQEFLDFLKWDIEVIRASEPSTVAFEVYQDPVNDDGLFVYECYRDAEAFAEHQRHEPFKQWVASVRTEMLQEFKLLFGPTTALLSKS